MVLPSAWGSGHDRCSGLVEKIGETANLAILEGSHALYVAQAPGRHAMRMFTEVGARVHLHSTGVGKALLAQLSDDEATKILELSGMPALTDHTITDPELLRHELAVTRARATPSMRGSRRPACHVSPCRFREHPSLPRSRSRLPLPA